MHTTIKIEGENIMKRLLRISFDTFITSVTPIISWFLLGILVDKNLINVFSLMYPIQFVVRSVQSIFGTGANVSAIKDNNKNNIFSGFLFGTIIGLIVLGFIGLNIDNYILFMNMDIKIYKVFAIYALVQTFWQLILNLILVKLYYEDNNKIANKYSFTFNIINFISLVIMGILSNNQILISLVSLSITGLYIIYLLFKNIKITNLTINLKNWIKYDSVELVEEISMLIIYLFGFKHAFNYGEKYILAVSFATLITDTQWDVACAIKTIAQIDITKKTFSLKEHLKNSRKLIYILVTSSLLMGLILYSFYVPNIEATLIIWLIEIISMYMYPIYITNLTYIQLEYSAIKAVIIKEISNSIRILCTMIPSPFCTSIGLILGVIYQLIATKYVIVKNKLILYC